MQSIYHKAGQVRRRGCVVSGEVRGKGVLIPPYKFLARF